MTTPKPKGGKADGIEPAGAASKGRARQAKGSVQEAIGKIIGNPVVERQGSRETAAGARQARAEHPATPPIDTDDKD